MMDTSKLNSIHTRVMTHPRKYEYRLVPFAVGQHLFLDGWTLLWNKVSGAHVVMYKLMED